MAKLETVVLKELTATEGELQVPQSGDGYKMPVVLEQATGNEVALDLAYTVNKAAGDDTGLLINQTDTASPGTSLFADFQVDGISRAAFRSNGLTFGLNTGNEIYSVYAGYSNRGRIDFSSFGDNNSYGLRLYSSDGSQLTLDNNGNHSLVTLINQANVSEAAFSLLPTIDQSGSGAATDLLINRTETAVGSGEQLLADFQVGGVSKVKFDNAGITTVDSLICATSYTVAGLPAGTVGQIARITDGDAALAWGATAVNSGAGATPYLVWYNGSAWTIMGK